MGCTVSGIAKELPRIKGSCNSDEINARVTLFKNLSKELCSVDRTGNASFLKGTIDFPLLSMLRSFIIFKNVYVTEKLRTAPPPFSSGRLVVMGYKRARKNTAFTTFRTLEPTLGVIPYGFLNVDYVLLYLFIYLFV